MVRAKFKCGDVVCNADQTEFAIRLDAVTYGSTENEEFFKYTPAGTISLSTINAEAAKHFEIGKEYYVDFNLAE